MKATRPNLWAFQKVIFYMIRVDGVLTFKDLFPSLYTLEVGKIVPDLAALPQLMSEVISTVLKIYTI